MFDYDWFYGGAYLQQRQSARLRVAYKRFPDVDRDSAAKHDKFQKFLKQLECRTLIYLRDGFSYEVKELAEDVAAKSHLAFETEPAEEVYRVGSFVVSVPFEEICRVEIYAVHPNEKPENKPLITGFRHAPMEEAKT